MNGENDSIKLRLDKINKALDEYENSKGLSNINPHNEGEKYLNISHDELQKLTPEILGEAAIILAQFGFHIQRAFNKEIAIMNWAEDETKRTIASEVNQYKASSYEERKQLAIRENESAGKLDRIRSYAKARSDRMSYLSSKIEFLARTFLELQQNKRRQHGNH